MGNKKFEKNYLESLVFMSLGIKYLVLVENVFSETIKQGNKWFIIFDNKEFSSEEYALSTSWSDFQIFVPTLFNFYHGLELIMKGILKTFNGEIAPNHKLTQLLSEIKKIPEISQNTKDIIENYTSGNFIKKSPVGEFLKENSINIDGLYEFLRYPSDKKFEKILNYSNIHYKEEKLIPYLEKIRTDSRKLRTEIVTAHRKKFKKQYARTS